MQCPSCRAQVPNGAIFCDQCGTPLAGAISPDASAAPQPFAPSPAGGGRTCPSCGILFTPDAAFCDNCGASLASVGVPQPQPQLLVQFPPLSGALTARLMIGGRAIAVPQKSQVVIGRADVASGSFPDIDLTPFGASPQTGVSRVHAKLTWQGAWMIEDMNSTNGTLLRGQKLAPHQKTPIHTGDSLIIGTLQLTFYAS